MSKCNSFICDLCKKHLENDDNCLFIKAKQRYYGWDCHGFTKVTLCVCPDCQNKLTELLNQSFSSSEQEV